MLKRFKAVMVVGALLLVASLGQGLGYNNRFDGLASSISGAVSSGNKTAIAIDKAIRASSTTRSKDFQTLSKIVKLAAKDEFQTVSEATLTNLFSAMVLDTAQYGVTAFSALAQKIIADPAHAAKYIKSQAKYIASQAKGIAKYNEYWVDVSPEDADLAKAAAAYAGVARLYEAIDRIYND